MLGRGAQASSMFARSASRRASSTATCSSPTRSSQGPPRC